jgi:Spy/CpxP family protein refolding chaperone
MTRRTLIGVVGLLAGGLAAGAGALAYGATQGGGPMHQRVMKRMVTAALDEALDDAKVTAEQRATVHAARDRVFTALESHRRDKQGRMDTVLGLFEADRLEAGQLDQFREQLAAEHRRIGDVIGAALVEIHEALTPEQRRSVAAWVRAHHRHHAH